MDNNDRNYYIDEKEEALILEQIKYLREECVSIQQFFVGLISVSLATYAIVIYYALSAEKDEIFLFLPFLFSLSIYNLLKYTVRVLGLDAYIRHLEKLINNKHQKSLFLWQSYLIYANGYSVFGSFPQLPCLLAICIFLAYQFCRAISSTEYPSYLIIILVILLIIQVAFLALMGVNCLTHYWAVLDICKKVPLTWLNEEDIEKRKTIKPQKLYFFKLLCAFYSKYIKAEKPAKEDEKVNEKIWW